MTTPRTLWIDADACPKTALAIARKVAPDYGFTLRTVSSYNHEHAGADHITVDASPEATDLAIVARMKAGDVVVTQDYGLAALVLARAGKAVSPSGLIYSADNIDSLLAARADHARWRRGGRVRVKGPAARRQEDDDHFSFALLQVLSG